MQVLRSSDKIFERTAGPIRFRREEEEEEEDEEEEEQEQEQEEQEQEREEEQEQERPAPGEEFASIDGGRTCNFFRVARP